LSGAGLRKCKSALRKCGADEPDAEPEQKRCGHGVRESAVEDLEPSVEDLKTVAAPIRFGVEVRTGLAVESIAPKIGCVPQTLLTWVKRQEIDAGVREEVTT